MGNNGSTNTETVKTGNVKPGHTPTP